MIPAKPTTRPTICRRPGRCWSRIEAMIGGEDRRAPLSMPATAESIHCWAIGNRVSGMVTQTRARTRCGDGPRDGLEPISPSG